VQSVELGGCVEFPSVIQDLAIHLAGPAIAPLAFGVIRKARSTLRRRRVIRALVQLSISGMPEWYTQAVIKHHHMLVKRNTRRLRNSDPHNFSDMAKDAADFAFVQLARRVYARRGRPLLLRLWLIRANDEGLVHELRKVAVRRCASDAAPRQPTFVQRIGPLS
jgi:hypothetical protein